MKRRKLDHESRNKVDRAAKLGTEPAWVGMAPERTETITGEDRSKSSWKAGTNKPRRYTRKEIIAFQRAQGDLQKQTPSRQQVNAMRREAVAQAKAELARKRQEAIDRLRQQLPARKQDQS
jgi:hypothetical protein